MRSPTGSHSSATWRWSPGRRSGIGRAAALALGRAGARVAVNHLPGAADAAAAVVGGLRPPGPRRWRSPPTSATRPGSRRCSAPSIARFGTLHVLVNNAGIQADAAFVEMSLADWRRVIEVNLTGQFLCARAAAREFLRRGVDPAVSKAAGKIVCMSSVHETIPWAGHANYAASKGGVHMLMRTLAQELAPSRVRVNAIAPGAVRTAINRAVWSNEAGRSGMLGLIPAGGSATPRTSPRRWCGSPRTSRTT